MQQLVSCKLRNALYLRACNQQHVNTARHVCRQATPLHEQKCYPCEQAQDALGSMGLSMIMDSETAEKYRAQLDSRWQIRKDELDRLRLKKVMRTKNFVKALELFQRIGEVAEAEGHHPDLHLESWNNVTVELWTHARDGLSDNDFIVAAKIDDLPIQDLLSKKQPALQ